MPGLVGQRARDKGQEGLAGMKRVLDGNSILPPDNVRSSTHRVGSQRAIPPLGSHPRETKMCVPWALVCKRAVQLCSQRLKTGKSPNVHQIHCRISTQQNPIRQEKSELLIICSSIDESQSLCTQVGKPFSVKGQTEFSGLCKSRHG